MTNIRNHFPKFLGSILTLLLIGYASIGSAQTYEGEKNAEGLAHGRGSLTFANGMKYSGDWKDGKKHGQGTETYPSGSSFSGEWKDNDMDGHGVARFNTRGNKGFKYVGLWKKGRMSGEGLWHLPTGQVISGNITEIPDPQPGKLEFFIDGIEYAFDPVGAGKFYRKDGKPLGDVNDIAAGENNISIAENQESMDAERLDDTQQLKGQKRIALLIGNANYQTSPLANPVNDVRGMATALRKAGFTVIKHENLNFRQMREAVRDFGEKLSKDHVGLFYYSGHGVQVDGRNYLIPVNSDIKYEDEVASSALDAEMVLAKLESAKNKLNIVVLDACRDSPLGRRTRTSTKGLSNMNAASGTMIAFSTAPGQVALDGKGSNSPYTKYLISAIQKEGLLLE